jgi:alpha-beta hydrolase superfamily lysophospholipase
MPDDYGGGRVSAVLGSPGRLVTSGLKVSPARPHAVRLVSANAGELTLAKTPDTRHRGLFGLLWPGGHAVVGDVLVDGTRTVTRRLIDVTGVPPVGALVRWNKFVYAGDPRTAHGIDFDKVIVDGPLGPLPTWSVPGPRSTWVVMVHGNRATGVEALRVVPTVHELGFPALIPSYRNDPAAPASPDGLYHLGDTEWADLEAAVDHALAAGATGVVLYGWSMGGSIVEAFLHRSSRRDHVRGVVLDAPILDPNAVTDAQLRRLHVPAWAGTVLKRMVANRSGIDFANLDHQRRRGRRPFPTLLFHGDADPLVPIHSSDAFAETHPESVTYIRVADCGHTLAWNAAPDVYREALVAFLTTGLR